MPTLFLHIEKEIVNKGIRKIKDSHCRFISQCISHNSIAKYLAEIPTLTKASKAEMRIIGLVCYLG